MEKTVSGKRNLGKENVSNELHVLRNGQEGSLLREFGVRATMERWRVRGESGFCGATLGAGILIHA